MRFRCIDCKRVPCCCWGTEFHGSTVNLARQFPRFLLEVRFMFTRQTLARASAAITTGSLLLASVVPAHAVFAVPEEITDAATNVCLVGAAVFTVMVGIKLYKWLRRAL
jgi:hypothetical protein